MINVCHLNVELNSMPKITLENYSNMSHVVRKPVVCKFIRNFVTKAQTSCAATLQIISTFELLHRNIHVVQALYYLNLKLQAPSPICVGPGRIPRT